MKKLLGYIFPIRDWLYIFQTLEYDRERFLSWIVHNFKKRNLEHKQELKATPKAIVLFVFAFLLMFLNFFLLYYFVFSSNLSCLLKLILSLTLFLLILQILFFYLWLASVLLLPPEYLFKMWYIQRARQKLCQYKDLIVIGITGSYGKTSTKEILAGLLDTEFKVLKTPENYNTALGIAKTILKDLTAEHQVFIVEMGAYQTGDIKKLCRIVWPKIGILTGISEQHLERFDTLENIIETKSELVESLPPEGLALLNFENDNVQKHTFENKVKKVSYSLNKLSSFRAEITESNKTGTSFIISYNNEKVHCRTKLLGQHNVLNCLPALCIGHNLGIPWKKLVDRLGEINPLPHRLQLIDSNPQITIIDDAYSSNPEGFKAALEVLNSFDGKRKIVITPGIVELGSKEKEIHVLLGQYAVKRCDRVILIGVNNRTKSLAEGLKQNGFEIDSIQFVDTLLEAQNQLPKLTQPGDVLLFENDLPDQY